jgi:hypothetical protein
MASTYIEACQAFACQDHTGKIFFLLRERTYELAHVVLGHTDTQAMMDDHLIRRDIKEVEAECVAYICCSTLDLTGLEESRHYIQEWMNGTPIEEKSARNILTAANKILDAGKPPVCYS